MKHHELHVRTRPFTDTNAHSYNLLSFTFVIGGSFKMEKSKFQCSNVYQKTYTLKNAIKVNTVLQSLTHFSKYSTELMWKTGERNVSVMWIYDFHVNTFMIFIPTISINNEIWISLYEWWSVNFGIKSYWKNGWMVRYRRECAKTFTYPKLVQIK